MIPRQWLSIGASCAWFWAGASCLQTDLLPGLFSSTKKSFWVVGVGVGALYSLCLKPFNQKRIPTEIRQWVKGIGWELGKELQIGKTTEFHRGRPQCGMVSSISPHVNSPQWDYWEDVFRKGKRLWSCTSVSQWSPAVSFIPLSCHIVFSFSRQHPPCENLPVIGTGAFTGDSWDSPLHVLHELIQKYRWFLVFLVRLPSEATGFLSGLTV